MIWFNMISGNEISFSFSSFIVVSYLPSLCFLTNVAASFSNFPSRSLFSHWKCTEPLYLKMFSPSADCHSGTHWNEVVNKQGNLLQLSNCSYWITETCQCHTLTMKATLDSADIIRNFPGLYFVMSPAKTLDFKQVTAKIQYTEIKLWYTRGLTLKGNRKLNKDSIKMVKKHSRKVEFRKKHL